MAAPGVLLVGLGQVGRLHAQRLLQRQDLRLAAAVDASESAANWARGHGIAVYRALDEAIAQTAPAAAIVATPNRTHAELGCACLAAGLVTLVEKPIADTLADAQRLCRAARERGVPLLVGHQRRHSPYLQIARRLIDEGRLGRIVSAQAMAHWLKPDAYFSAPGTQWRRGAGGGPVLINLVHDIDMLLHLLGPVLTVQALCSNAVRGFEVEDTAVVLMRFAGGALATLGTSDCTASPWNYDLAAGENASFPRIDVDALWLCGTAGSLSLPRLRWWHYAGARGWNEPLDEVRLAAPRHDPYDEQLRQLRAVIDGREAPVCSGEHGLAALRAALAVHASARDGAAVALDEAQAFTP